MSLPSRPSPALRRLLEGPLDSFEKLEIAIALRGAPAHALSAMELSKKLSMPADLVARAIEDLRRISMVEAAGGLVRLQMSSEDLVAMDELVTLYDEDRILVVRTLSEIAMEKIRGMAARTFADAFHIRKKREDDDG